MLMGQMPVFLLAWSTDIGGISGLSIKAIALSVTGVY